MRPFSLARSIRAGDTRGTGEGGGEGEGAKRKKRNKGKKQRALKQQLLKECHQSQHVTVLAILEHLEIKTFSCRPTMVADNTFECFMAPSLWNPFRRPWVYLPSSRAAVYISLSSYQIHWLNILLYLKKKNKIPILTWVLVTNKILK